MAVEKSHAACVAVPVNFNQVVNVLVMTELKIAVDAKGRVMSMTALQEAHTVLPQADRKVQHPMYQAPLKEAAAYGLLYSALSAV